MAKGKEAKRKTKTEGQFQDKGKRYKKSSMYA